MTLRDGYPVSIFSYFFVLALTSIATSAVRYHNMINTSSNTVRLTEDNTVLANTSRHDGLTGLLNRLALEDDAQKSDGREMTVYMIDINYFKDLADMTDGKPDNIYCKVTAILAGIICMENFEV